MRTFLGCSQDNAGWAFYDTLASTCARHCVLCVRVMSIIVSQCPQPDLGQQPVRAAKVPCIHDSWMDTIQ